MAYALLNLGGWAAQRIGRSGEGWTSGGPPRNSWRRAAPLVGPLLAFVAAGCFTGPINHAPEIVISGAATPPRKMTAIYTAKATDRDGDQVSVMWDRVPGPCTTDTGPDSWPPSKDWKTSVGDEATLALEGDDTDVPFCVWAFAIDSHGAKGADHMAVVPQDQAPTAMIKVVSPDPAAIMGAEPMYPLYSTIELRPSSSDPEGDKVTPSTPTLDSKPSGSAAMVAPCGPAGGTDVCFVADVMGEYDVSFTVMDASGQQGTAAPLKIIVLPDEPPCIGTTVPDFVMSPMVEVTLPPPADQTPDSLPSFTIRSVTDDGAPWPPGPKGGTQFRWYVSTNGGTFQFFNNDYPKVGLAYTGVYKLGDSVKVRVEVSDHNPTNDAALVACGDADICERAIPGNPACFQRVTWSVDFR